MAKKPRRYSRRAEKLISILMDEGMSRWRAIQTLKHVARAFVADCKPAKPKHPAVAVEFAKSTSKKFEKAYRQR